MQEKSDASESLDVPTEFDKAMQGIVGTPKEEVDKAEEKERQKKDADGQK